jgi:hypothetical protein
MIVNGKANCNGTMANPNREDEYPYPPPGSDWEFGPKEDERMYVCRDGTSSASNAAKLAWIDNEVISTVCFVHAGPIWLKKSEHRAYFKNTDNIEVFSKDLNAYKTTPFVHIVDGMHEAMIAKWSSRPVLEALSCSHG